MQWPCADAVARDPRGGCGPSRRGSFSYGSEIGNRSADFFATGSAPSYQDDESPRGPGRGFWYVFRHDCAAGTHSTSTPGEEPGRDAALVLPTEELAVSSPSQVLTTSYWKSNDGAPNNMISGKGLTRIGNNVLNWIHDASPNATTMWHAGLLDGGLGGPTGNPPIVADQGVVFDMRTPVEITDSYIWNHNQAGLTGRGVYFFELFVSTDADPATASWTSLGFVGVAKGCDCSTEHPVAVAWGVPPQRLVKFDIQLAWSGQVSDYVGLSEVLFRKLPACGGGSEDLQGLSFGSNLWRFPSHLDRSPGGFSCGILLLLRE